jgi:hypothetical protein
LLWSPGKLLANVVAACSRTRGAERPGSNLDPRVISRSEVEADVMGVLWIRGLLHPLDMEIDSHVCDAIEFPDE